MKSIASATMVVLVHLAFCASVKFDAAGNQVNATFGQVTAARDPRIMQFALRIDF
ncbi:MAG TPA: hypothetical protein VFZ98_06955 [Vicinamibacterales bacterium]